MILPSAIDRPVHGSLNDPLALHIEGWLHGGKQHAQLKSVEICSDGKMLGKTSIFFVRPDVNRIFQFAPDTATGFTLFLSAPELFGQTLVPLKCFARFEDGSEGPGAAREINLITHDHRNDAYGVLARPNEARLFHRSDIYTSGASVADISGECLALIQRYLGDPPRSVLDVGCGFGGYGRALLAAGFNWFGVEVKDSDCAELKRVGLPHQKVDGETLPFADATYNDAICVEVLEHIVDPAKFIAEIRRVIRRRLLVSVPNLELIPYLHRHLVVPWHLLEGDHKNFFTRPSLRATLSPFFRNVEVLSYAEIPLRTPEGLPLHNHLFAICDV